MEDNVGIETSEVYGLAYSKETSDYVEDKHRASSGLRGSEKKKNTEDKDKDGAKRSDYKDNRQEMVEGYDFVGCKGGHEGRPVAVGSEERLGCTKIGARKDIRAEQASLN